MAEYAQRHAALTDVADHAGGPFYGMKGIIKFFSDKVSNIADSKDLNTTEIPMIMSYAREV